mmetsp:Transcript_8166/g.9412  ORF Transcript_8166/g.9412 Transcript_8166/m.9412 type:complete len:85 (+) Transcript_8166:130-384(+)
MVRIHLGLSKQRERRKIFQAFVLLLSELDPSFSKHTAKFKHNMVNGIFLGFVPRTHRNILWYYCETGNIGPANHVTFDEVMQKS